MAHFKMDLGGGYFLNGRPVSLDEAKKECARLARIGGVVFYYREDPREDPPPEAEALIAAICAARLPLTFAGRDYDASVPVNQYFPGRA